MTSSRALAQTWAYPRHKPYEEGLQQVASGWFRERDLPPSKRYPYILDEPKLWHRNIILREVARYIQEEAERRHFPLHKYLHHGLSSQAMLFNLVGPLVVSGDLVPLGQALAGRGIALPGGTLRASFEYEDQTVFNEDPRQPTSLDLMLEGEPGSARVFVEAKLVEKEFGGCSVFAAGDCDGRNPAREPALCYLHHVGRRYWDRMEAHGFLSGPIRDSPTCILSTYYQFFREVLFALEKNGSFVLLHDARNPTFYCDGPQGPRGLMPFLESLLPASARESIGIVTIQQVVAAIKESGRHGWIAEFEHKYGLMQSSGG